MKNKKTIGNVSPAAPPVIIEEKSGGSSGLLWPAVIVGGGIAAYLFVVKPAIAQHSENAAESDTSPEAAIANQFKTVFGGRGDKKWYVSDADYRSAAALLTDQNKPTVFKIYRGLTDRNLSDDIAQHESQDVVSDAQEIQAQNSKPGRLFSYNPDGSIKFEVVKNDFIKFDPANKSPITVYSSALAIVLNELKGNPDQAKILAKLKSNPKTAALSVSIGIPANKNKYRVVDMQQIPLTSLKASTDFWAIFHPFATQTKTLAAIKILAGTQKGKPVYAWIDGRDMISDKAPVNGLGKPEYFKRYEIITGWVDDDEKKSFNPGEVYLGIKKNKDIVTLYKAGRPYYDAPLMALPYTPALRETFKPASENRRPVNGMGSISLVL